MNNPLAADLYMVLMRLRNGGALVPAHECTEAEVTRAHVAGRVYVDRDGFVFVYLPGPLARRPLGA